MAISSGDGSALLGLLSLGKVTVRLPDPTIDIPGEGRETAVRLSSFSSVGPSYDQRTKPDLACPGGGIASARAGVVSSTAAACGASSLVVMSGTSMATPCCAGAAALVRQYLREGRHLEENVSLNPSAALVKAVMLGGGQTLYTQVSLFLAIIEPIGIVTGIIYY